LRNAKSGIDGEACPGFRFTQSGLRLLRKRCEMRDSERRGKLGCRFAHPGDACCVSAARCGIASGEGNSDVASLIRATHAVTVIHPISKWSETLSMRNNLIEYLTQRLLMIWTDAVLQLPTCYRLGDFVFHAQFSNNLPHGVYIDR
jgi:hypothetical protein